MNAAVVLISEKGRETADRLAQYLGAKVIRRTSVEKHWNSTECFVFVGAVGICVRTIAPLLKDKHSDPAVVCTDTFGKEVISVLSGHIGGANKLAGEIATVLSAHAVITTQTDNCGLWALDLLAEKFGWTQKEKSINKQISLYAKGCKTALLLEVQDEGTEWMEENLSGNITVFRRWKDINLAKLDLLLSVSPLRRDIQIPNIQWIPKCIHIGVGLAKMAGPTKLVIKEIFNCLKENGIEKEAVATISSVDIKAGEPVFQELGKKYDLLFYSPDALNNVEVPSPSKVVKKHVGTSSVAEASVILTSGNKELLVKKHKGFNWTLASAVDSLFIPHAHIEIVGAGPGDPDLISVRGRKMLERADLILYAGSLVPKELTFCAKPSATVVSSADMNLEEQCALMKKFYDNGKFIVRLHTGDPCIFGAIQEQMAFFDKHNMEYHITPGISSFLAAAAELKSQFTIPEKCQTIILTRGEGRTPTPSKEKLHLLARSNSTMCIFLSAAIVDNVQKELLMEYPEDTPVAACYHITWPDQRIYRGKLKDLSKIVHSNHLTLTTMLVVGESIGNRKGLSELYSKNFSHLFRKAK